MTGKLILYQGGRGNIQKGLDLLIEAFAAEPVVHLYIDSPIEFEALSNYKTQLSLSNIHYYEWQSRFPGGMRSILEKCACVLHAGMNSGQSTALLGALYHGLVPVVTRDANLNLGALEVPMEEATSSAILAAIRSAAALSLPEIANRALLVAAAFRERFSPDAYRNGFRRAIASLVL